MQPWSWWRRNVLRPPVYAPCPVRISAFLVQPPTPGSYYPPLRLGWVVISCPLWAIVGSGVESIIDNYKRRSPAWSSFLCGPEGQTFFLRRACHRPRRLRLRHGLRTQRRRRRRLHVVRRGRQTAKSQYIRRRLQLRRGRRRHVRVLARPRPHSTRPTRTLNA